MGYAIKLLLKYSRNFALIAMIFIFLIFSFYESNPKEYNLLNVHSTKFSYWKTVHLQYKTSFFVVVLKKITHLPKRDC